MADNLADKEKRCLPNKKYLSGKNHLGTIGAGDGGRTHTVSPPTDFESVSSANSNTPAYEQRYYYNCIAPRCQAGRRDLSFFKKQIFLKKSVDKRPAHRYNYMRRLMTGAALYCPIAQLVRAPDC